ncbi:MAG: hydrogenase [Lentisphaerae bacterium]|nr:hydrogenase [Lentisphaerota bacterium]
MIQFNELLLALFMTSCLMLAVSSRLLHCIRLVALQGIILGILPLSLAGMSGAGGNWTMAVINLTLKGVLLPLLLLLAMKKAGVKRELEPIVGYSFSAAAVLLMALCSFYLGRILQLPSGASALAGIAIPAAFTTVMTGLFLIIARKKALTQVIGFLVFENGITLFGAAVMREHPVIVELGILLDVLVLVFIMGITVFQISREFSHIDADRLNQLDDISTGREVQR